MTTGTERPLSDLESVCARGSAPPWTPNDYVASARRRCTLLEPTRLAEVFMPRRSSGEIRAELLRRPRWHPVLPARAVSINGVSSATIHQIADFERSRDAATGQVAEALHRWGAWGRCPRADRWRYGWQYSPPFADDRALLESALAALRGPAKRQFRSLLNPLDERFRARTVPDPSAAASAPWWRRRMEL
jgi:hypothetical protein